MISKHSMMHQGEELYQIHIYIFDPELFYSKFDIGRPCMEWGKL